MDRITLGILTGIATLIFLLAVVAGWISPVVAVEAVVMLGITVAFIIMRSEGTVVGVAVTVVIAGIIIGVSFAISGSVAFASLVIGVILGIFWASAIKETLK